MIPRWILRPSVRLLASDLPVAIQRHLDGPHFAAALNVARMAPDLLATVLDRPACCAVGPRLNSPR